MSASFVMTYRYLGMFFTIMAGTVGGFVVRSTEFWLGAAVRVLITKTIDERRLTV